MFSTKFVLSTLLFITLVTHRVVADEPEKDPVLLKYEGDWLFRGDRKQIWYALVRDQKDKLLFRERVIAICGLVERKWVIHSKNADGKYMGTIRTVFQGETTAKVVGEWDDERQTMTWTVEDDPTYARIRHQFKGTKMIVTTLRKTDDPARDAWNEFGTLSLLGQ